MYQTLYRKYRPSNFDEVVGQKIIVQTLKNAFKNNKLSHAYIFTGPRGTGKTSIAKILARTINCEDINEYVPCNKCTNCVQNNLNPIDIIEIDAASNNGVDEIRELKNKINLVPAFGKYKIYIIDEVHMLSTGAFNALLKTLEEPPKHVIFVLATTDPHKVPATILSRCQRFDFKKLTVDEIFNRLKDVSIKENIEVTDEALKEIANLSDGGMRDSLSLLDQVISYSVDKIKIEDVHEINGTITKEEINNFIKLIIAADLEETFLKIDKYNEMGKDFIKLTEEIILFLRNLLLFLNVPNLYNEKENYKFDNELLENLDINKIMMYIKEFNNGIIEMKNSNNPKIMFELIIIKLVDYKNTTQEKKIELTKEEPLNKNVVKIRINNTLCNFNKKQLIEFKGKINELEIYNSDSKYTEFVSLIFDGELKAIGNDYLIFVFENEKYTKYYNENLKIIDELFLKAYNFVYKSIAVSKSEWEIIKDEYNSKKREYKFINE